MNVPGTWLGVLHDCLFDPHNSPMKEKLQHRFIILAFRRTEVLRSRVSRALCLWRLSLSLPSPLSRGCLPPWSLPHSPLPSAAVLTPSLPLLHHHVTLSDSGPWWLYGAHSDKPGKSLQFKIFNLITSAKSFLSCKVPYSQVLGITTWTSWGPLSSPPQIEASVGTVCVKESHPRLGMLLPFLISLFRPSTKPWGTCVQSCWVPPPHCPVSAPPHPPPEHKHREALEKEKERLQNMDEEEYEALTEEEKFMFDREVQQALRERKKRWESRAGTCAGCTAHPGAWRLGLSSRVATKATGGQQGNILPTQRAGWYSLAGFLPFCSPLLPLWCASATRGKAI